MDATLRNGPPDSAVEWTASQAKLLQDTWLLTLFVVLLAVAVPWFIGGLQIDFAAASVALMALAALYAGLVLAGESRAPSARMRRRLLGLLHMAGVIGVGWLWQRSAGLQNPAFLLAFALPVIGAAALSRWQPYATAVLAIAVVGIVALVQAPELRWYAGSAHGAYRWLNGWFGGATQGDESVLPGFYAPVAYDVVLLQVFAILILGCAVVAESLGNAFEKLLEHLRVARGDAAQREELWTRLLLQLPLPSLLVEVETQQIVLTSRQLAPFWADEHSLEACGLFDALQCTYPERLQQLISADGGVAEAVVVHVQESERVARVHVRHVVFDGRRLALVLLEDVTDAFCTAAALDAQEHPFLVIDARGRIVTANKPARALFPEISAGGEADRVLLRANAAGASVSRWWEPGLTCVACTSLRARQWHCLEGTRLYTSWLSLRCCRPRPPRAAAWLRWVQTDEQCTRHPARGPASGSLQRRCGQGAPPSRLSRLDSCPGHRARPARRLEAGRTEYAATCAAVARGGPGVRRSGCALAADAAAQHA